MTSKGVLENREEQPLEIVKGHARSLMVGRRFGRSGKRKVCASVTMLSNG
jgi:hypothetical protein